MIHAMKIIHTITSPNTIMNAAPPVIRTVAVITINTMNISIKIVDRIIFMPPFRKRKSFSREFIYVAYQTSFPIVLLVEA